MLQSQSHQIVLDGRYLLFDWNFAETKLLCLCGRTRHFNKKTFLFPCVFMIALYRIKSKAPS